MVSWKRTHTGSGRLELRGRQINRTSVQQSLRRSLRPRGPLEGPVVSIVMTIREARVNLSHRVTAGTHSGGNAVRGLDTDASDSSARARQGTSARESGSDCRRAAQLDAAWCGERTPGCRGSRCSISGSADQRVDLRRGGRSPLADLLVPDPRCTRHAALRAVRRS